MTFELTTFISASPKEVYSSWLNGDQHAAMTGAPATGKPEIGAEFTAWDGYISGKNKELVQDEKIVQSWRTTEFKDDDDDSILEVHLKPADGGCELTLIHSRIPENQPDYEQGWSDNYFDPMKEYFGE